MIDYVVAEITELKALELNDGLIDDDKVAFANEDNTRFFVKQQWADDNLNKSDLINASILLSQSEVDGTLPVVKRLRVYP